MANSSSGKRLSYKKLVRRLRILARITGQISSTQPGFDFGHHHKAEVGSGRQGASPRVTDPTDAEIRAEYERRQTGEILTTCVMCPKPLKGRRSHQKFCSGKCRTAYYRIRLALRKEKSDGQRSE